jgi:hypothetical protein
MHFFKHFRLKKFCQLIVFLSYCLFVLRLKLIGPQEKPFHIFDCV